jgi:hypothetical protein
MQMYTARLALLATLAFLLVGSAMARPAPGMEVVRQATETAVRSGLTVANQFANSEIATDLKSAAEAWLSAWAPR